MNAKNVEPDGNFTEDNEEVFEEQTVTYKEPASYLTPEMKQAYETAINRDKTLKVSAYML